MNTFCNKCDKKLEQDNKFCKFCGQAVEKSNPIVTRQKIENKEQFIKKFIGEILVTVGVGTFFYNIFNFDYRTYGKGGPLLKLQGITEIEGIAYYYKGDVLIMIALGAMLATIGILIIKNRQK